MVPFLPLMFVETPYRSVLGQDMLGRILVIDRLRDASKKRLQFLRRNVWTGFPRRVYSRNLILGLDHLRDFFIPECDTNYILAYLFAK